VERKRSVTRSFAWSIAFACLLCIGFNSATLAESDKLKVRVMTRNMDAGTYLNYITFAASDAELLAGLQLTVE
jgi:hypothetical protein